MKYSSFSDFASRLNLILMLLMSRPQYASNTQANTQADNSKILLLSHPHHQCTLCRVSEFDGVMDDIAAFVLL
jgi:hypothetical protein